MLAKDLRYKHVALAAGVPSGGHITVYQEPSLGYSAEITTNLLTDYPRAYRYNNITDDTPIQILEGEQDMIIYAPDGSGYLLSGGSLFAIHTSAPAIDLQGKGVPFTTVDTDTWNGMVKNVIQ